MPRLASRKENRVDAPPPHCTAFFREGRKTSLDPGEADLLLEVSPPEAGQLEELELLLLLLEVEERLQAKPEPLHPGAPSPKRAESCLKVSVKENFSSSPCLRKLMMGSNILMA